MANNESNGHYSPLPPWRRSDYCGALRESDSGREVALWGWVAVRRDHGGLIFVDLRDREGIVQIVFNPERNAAAHTVARGMRAEYYVAVKGTVVRRAEGTVNAELPTGQIEVMASEAEVLNASAPPPFMVSDDTEAAEEVRLKYRYLDLRRPRMQQNLRRRHLAMRAVRDYLDGEGFVEVETPILWRPTPEGARDYVVPSRVNPGKFYALPQSPQLLKQLLMVGGLDRYYQIARCFRDEDLRANRQPEFSQVDIEMTGPRPDDIYALIEGVMVSVYERVLGIKLAPPFIRIPYEEVMERFGIDKPDMRFDLELKRLDGALEGTGFKVFSEALARGDSIYGIRLPARFQLTRRDLDTSAEAMRSRLGLGLAWVKTGADDWSGPVAKHLGANERRLLGEAVALEAGDTLLMVAGPRDKVRPALGELRLQLAEKFELRKSGEPRFLWVVDFPLFEYNEEEKRLFSVNHPFTAPRPEDLVEMERACAELKQGNSRAAIDAALKPHALCYDLVLNGEEMGGGSIRIHDRELQLKVFELLGFSREEAMDKFGFLIDALGYGAPPHGGIALGVERLVMMLCGTESLRDVMAFPKSQRAADPMSGAPAAISAGQLKELSIRVQS